MNNEQPSYFTITVATFGVDLVCQLDIGFPKLAAGARFNANAIACSDFGFYPVSGKCYLGTS